MIQTEYIIQKLFFNKETRRRMINKLIANEHYAYRISNEKLNKTLPVSQITCEDCYDFIFTKRQINKINKCVKRHGGCLLIFTKTQLNNFRTQYDNLFKEFCKNENQDLLEKKLGFVDEKEESEEEQQTELTKTEDIENEIELIQQQLKEITEKLRLLTN